MAAMNPRGRPVEELRHCLREAGLRATPSRIAVLDVLRNADRPLSHADVVEALDGEAWNRTTIYRNLIDLVDAGLVHKSDLGDRTWRFETSHPDHDAEDHPHFVCTECGTVECLPDLEVSMSDSKNEVPAAVTEHRFEVHIRGRCDDCD